MKPLLCGFTTGANAAAAAKAATMLLRGAAIVDSVLITLPDGEAVAFKIVESSIEGGRATASVIKFAGDDPDVTNGVKITAAVELSEAEGITYIAGGGVGTVTKPGLQIPPGEPAINPVPRKMIEAAIREITAENVAVTISIEGGEELAKKTFNPKLGIAGGLSVLGTTGRVVPYSCPAVRETLKCVLDVALAAGVREPVFVPGNIGARAARRHFQLSRESLIEAGNEWGYMIDLLAKADVDALLVMGHPGKLAKLPAGSWDTHSSRSPSAVPFILDAARKLFGKELGESTTVEGVFAALDEDERNKLACEVSRLVSEAVAGRLGGEIVPAVALIGMDGDILGTYGDLSRRRRSG